MKLFSPAQIKELDEATCRAQSITSLDLMERAGDACTQRILSLCEYDWSIHIYCGMGNNGGDGLVIARYLSILKFKVTALVIIHQNNFTPEAKNNLEDLKKKFPENVKEIISIRDLPEESPDLTVDCLLGIGLNKPVDGFLGEVIDYLNKKKKLCVSIDTPSGLFADRPSTDNKHIVACDLCLTFQFPKLSFLLPSSQPYLQNFEMIDIDLDPAEIKTKQATHFFVTREDVKSLMTARTRFSHKGTYGHALLLAGSRGKSGAAVISAKGCLKSGVGLLTVHSTTDTLKSLMLHLPEAMSQEDAHSDFITEVELKNNYSAVAIGPGIGTEDDTQLVLKKLLNFYQGKLVLDADALNILSENKTWLSFLPPDTILTPHPKEFERLTEKTDNDFERLSLLRQFSIRHNCIVVLKNAFSAIAMPDGNIFFNSSGNPGLAKGGSGDALTGIILGLLARGYNPAKAALIGSYVHGFAADLCAKEQSWESMLASDVINKLPQAFLLLEKNEAEGEG